MKDPNNKVLIKKKNELYELFWWITIKMETRNPIIIDCPYIVTVNLPIESSCHRKKFNPPPFNMINCFDVWKKKSMQVAL